MKIVHRDEERLVIETWLQSLQGKWIVFGLFTFIWLGVGGGIIAQTRSIRCEKIEPTIVNCYITDTLFWGALRRVKVVNGVQRVFIDEEIGYSDASQYPIYKVFLATNNAQEVPFTNWERSLDFTNRVKNSLETFLKSETTTYQFTLNNYRNIVGAIFFIGVNSINLLFLIADPYRKRLILDKTANQALMIVNFVLNTRKESLNLGRVSLKFMEDTDSDGDTYYAVLLNTPGIGDKSYSLKSSSNRQVVEDYWRTNPDIQTLKEFVRSEEILPNS
ncbi:hypothetical protein GlitD10_1690 [Gloeomargarita lithophora Alchichica-D10]|uniref:Uncharacterized protein n=1 Tax=Gloeomargarita lithophora Alchichica-D10 TaxID=1188229 RepID=A0A1J0ADM9_9CYAN|nr:hypothetical protein [Gloeomargarita lithophora]APB34015.1 hypothetical protein GlitD10_1690 [Gloeomargarita lithophora Alchichica-D10]